jgi:glycosyltransferase involved in cell wall biosynthesis
VIGNVGRLCAQKNQPRLVNIFCAVLRKRPDARLLLVGEGELHGQILALVEQYGLGDRVLLTGVRPDVGALLCAMDVFVLPSTHEGLPFSLLEAQCSGLPAIVSDTVTTEAALTDAVDFCSLDESDEHWAARIVDALDRARTPAPDALRRAGYDMDTEAGVLSRFYRERQSAAQEK